MSKKQLSNKGRKRSNAPMQKVVKVDFSALKPITQIEANMFQQLIQLSNAFGKLKQQKAEYEMILTSLKDRRKDVQKGKIKLPIMLPLGKNKYYNCSDIKYVLQEMDGEIEIIANALKGIEGQISSNFDAYVEAGLRINNFTDAKFSQYKPKNTYSRGCNPKKEERVLFEAELDELEKDPELKKQFKKAAKKATVLNKA